MVLEAEKFKINALADLDGGRAKRDPLDLFYKSTKSYL
jgi:hypothetical protein